MGDLPASVLFCCTFNVIRSAMAEGILKYLHGRDIYVQSAGVRAGTPDGFAIQVMDEIGIDLSRHRPRTVDQLEDDFFDLVISLSPQAQHRAVELTRNNATTLEFWNMPDPSLSRGAREQVLDGYREVRDLLMERISRRFPVEGGMARS
jgi:protein-tyrosine-phosphatase